MKFLLFGIIQGVTEFLPISSSGHLYLLKKIFGVSENLLSFFIILHLATLLAIAIFFQKQIKKLLFSKILPHILIITAITAGLGLMIKRFLSPFFEYKYFIPSCILINAVILLSIKKFSAKKNSQDIRLKDSLILGILQGLAVLPGISRSGITISGLLKRGFKAKDSFTLSFLMAIPIISGVTLLELKEICSLNIGKSNIFLSFSAALIFGIFTLQIIKKMLIKAKFQNFGYYCLILFIASLFICK